MTFAVRVDGQGYRPVNGESDLLPGEVLSDVMPTETLPLPPTVQELTTRERSWRDAEIERVKWLRERHRDQLDIGQQTTLTDEQFTELLVYMQALRDWPQSLDFPQIEFRPVVPPWITEQTE